MRHKGETKKFIIVLVWILHWLLFVALLLWSRFILFLLISNCDNYFEHLILFRYLYVGFSIVLILQWRKFPYFRYQTHFKEVNSKPQSILRRFYYVILIWSIKIQALKHKRSSCIKSAQRMRLPTLVHSHA